MAIKIEKMAIELNKLWKVERNLHPSCLDIYEAKKFKECMERYSKKIVTLEDDNDVAGSAEALSEMLLMVLSYIDRKGFSKTLHSTCEICFNDLKRYLIIKDLEEEQDNFLFITEGQHEKTKIKSDVNPKEEIEKLFKEKKRQYKEKRRRRVESEEKKYKPTNNNLL